MPQVQPQVTLVTSTPEAPLTEAPVKIPKKRGRKPKPKPLPEDGFKIIFGDFIIDFNQ